MSNTREQTVSEWHARIVRRSVTAEAEAEGQPVPAMWLQLAHDSSRRRVPLLMTQSQSFGSTGDIYGIEATIWRCWGRRVTRDRVLSRAVPGLAAGTRR